MKKFTWWVIAAALIAGMQVIFGVGNLIEDDGGPLYGQILFLAVLAAGAALTAAGIRVRGRDRARGGAMIAVGILPSMTGVTFVWFPPAVACGALALVVAIVAFTDGPRSPREPAVP